MIKFRQKVFVAPLIAGAGKLLAGSKVAVGLQIAGGVQERKTAATMERQNEEMIHQQERAAKRTQEALNKVAKAAEKDPNKASAAMQVMQQKSYASPANLLKTGGQVVYEFARGIGGKKAAKVLGSGLAMGAGMAIGSYAVDKAIQADRKRITGGAPLPTVQKSPEEVSKEKKKKIAKLATAGALTAGTIIAARTGALGQGFKNLSRGLNSAGEKINFKGLGQSVKHHFKEGIGIKTINPTARDLAVAKTKGITLKPKTKFSPGPLLGGVGFAGLFAAPYVLGERKQLKEQAKSQQQKEYSDNIQYRQEQQPKKNGSVLKKLAIGAAVTAGTVATLRRVGPTGIRKGINDMYMTYGKKLAGSGGTGKIGNWMMKSGSQEYGKAVVKARNSALQRQIKAGQKAAGGGGLFDKILGTKQEHLDKIAQIGEKAKNTAASINLDATKIGQARLEKIKAGKATRKIGQDILEKLGGAMGAGKQNTTNYLNRLTNTNPKSGIVYSKETQEIANFLKRHKRTAAVGGIAVGSLTFKPFTWGDKAARGAVKAIDKNAFAYEKSKEQQVQ